MGDKFVNEELEKEYKEKWLLLQEGKITKEQWLEVCERVLAYIMEEDEKDSCNLDCENCGRCD